MPVKIDDKPDLPLLTNLLEEGLNADHLRTIHILLCDIPLPIQILPHQVTSITAIDNPIHIHHRDHINLIVLQQHLTLLTSR